MLDYAANAVSYWPEGVIREKFDSGCESRGEDPDIRVAELLGVEPNNQDSIEDFWNQVTTNLQAGKIRLIFLADIIPKELQRIVEFLNKQMDPAEVLAVEIRQYVGEGLKTLFPEAIGLIKQPPIVNGKWDEPAFFQEKAAKGGPIEVEVAKAILDWAKGNANRIWWGEGKKLGSFTAVVEHKGVSHYPIAVVTNGVVYINFYYLKMKSPFDNEDLRRELLRRINEAPESVYRRRTLQKAHQYLSNPWRSRCFGKVP